MNLPGDTPQPEETSPPEEDPRAWASLPEGFRPLGDSGSLSRARRRRSQRLLAPLGEDEKTQRLAELARRAFPTFDFFLFAFLSGLILGAAYLLNTPALLLLGILLAPILTPWVGLTLAAATGSWRFFFLTLFAMLVATGLVFLTGFGAGWAARYLETPPLFYTRIYSQLWWADLLIVVLGAAVLAGSFVHSEKKPFVASAMLAYGFFLPASAAGLGLGLGNPAGAQFWPNAALVLLVHAALAFLSGWFILAILRFKPAKFGGHLLPILLVLSAAAAVVALTGLISLARDFITSSRHTPPTPTVLVLPTRAPTQLPTNTLPATSEPTVTGTSTPTLEPTPAYALIIASTGGGANLRSEPGSGYVIAVITNGVTVQILPEVELSGGVPWVRVLTSEGYEGWVLQSLLVPTQPTLTLPTLTSTP